MIGKKLDGIIFDFNGVLLWDNPLHEEAWGRISTRLRGRPMSAGEMKTAVHGRVNRDIFGYVLGRELADDELQLLVEEKESLYRRLALESGDAYHLSPGAAALLDFLVANHIPRAIATSSPGINVTFFIEQLDLRRWFTPETIIYDRNVYPGKPAPGIYQEAAERLGAPPERFVVVEDSVAGIRSAHAAGIGAIVAIGPAEMQATLASLPGVDEVIATLEQFPRARLSAATEETR
ncbi:MAG: HAD family phosphatase [Candidatus Promineofilum sp.]|nr:HAD family phosphatase [Promineifilum sp.]